MEESKFHHNYQDLEKRFREQAISEGTIYLPNVEPEGKVDYVFIAMEPSFGSWVSSVKKAKKKINNGFRNFIYSYEDFILHYSIKEFLCIKNQTYHIKDISKGAMLVEEAQNDRNNRYQSWYELLLDELELVCKSNCYVFAIGKKVESFLKQQNLGKLSSTLLHYSPVAARWRDKCINGKKDEFNNFLKQIHNEDILASASEILDEIDLSEKIRKETIMRLSKSELSISRTKLLFCYRNTFNEFKIKVQDQDI